MVNAMTERVVAVKAHKESSGPGLKAAQSKSNEVHSRAVLLKPYGCRQKRQSPLKDKRVFALGAKIRVVPRKYVFRPWLGWRTVFLQMCKRKHPEERGRKQFKKERIF